MPVNRKNIKNIIWDLSGTLFTPKTVSNPALGLISYIWGGKSTPNSLEQIAITLLEQLGTQDLTGSKLIRFTNGNLVPSLICSWLEGKINSADAQKQVFDLCQKKLGQSFFNNLDTAYKIQELLEYCFNPAATAHIMEPVGDISEILELCNSNKNNRLYILSNWDHDSFEILYNLETGQKIFNYFKRENIIISAQAHALKPRPEIFEYCIKKQNLDTAETLMIDNQKENLDTAKEFGIYGILFDRKKIDVLKKELIELKII